MTVDTRRDSVQRALSEGNGILRLAPAWVARDFLPPGCRLGLAEDAYQMGARGAICERWLGSTTKADNRVGPADEGLSYLALDGADRITLQEAVATDPVSIMGAEYAATHEGLGRLAKIFDYSTRLPLHLHQRSEHAALVGRRSKEEAYYLPPGVDMGPHPESFFGVHPSVARNPALLLPHLQDWNSDLILQHSVAFLQVSEQGFHVPAGVLHGPGSALTIELQEDSDVFAMLQALNAGTIISKELLWKDVRPSDRDAKGERFILELIDWEENGDPYFYDHHHLSPRLIEESRQDGGEEFWVYYNTAKFSGKKLVVHPGCSYLSRDAGVHNVLVWSGSGSYAGLAVQGGDPELDEVLVTHDSAVRGVEVRNTGRDDLLAIKFFGPDVNPDVPMISRHKTGEH
jgi:hypothetical protein